MNISAEDMVEIAAMNKAKLGWSFDVLAQTAAVAASASAKFANLRVHTRPA